MAWTRSQQVAFFKACNLVELSDTQRYMVMRHACCPQRKTAGANGKMVDRPSAAHPDNTNQHFECAMAMVEAHGAAKRISIAPPRRWGTWHEAALGGVASRILARFDQVMTELERKAPRYDWSAQLRKLVETNHKAAVRDGAIPASAFPVSSVADLDAATMLKTLRGLEYIGVKELHKLGLHADYRRSRRKAS